MTTLQIVQANLRLRLSYLKLTSRLAAEMTGMSRQQFERILKGDNWPNLSTIDALAEGLKCAPKDLLDPDWNGEDND